MLYVGYNRFGVIWFCLVECDVCSGFYGEDLYWG